MTRIANAAFYAFITFFLILTAAKIPVVFAGRDYSNINLKLPEPKFTALYDDAGYIKRLTNEKAIPVFMEDDGRLLLWAGKINYFYVTDNRERITSFYDDAQIIYKSQVRSFVEQLQKGNPQYVFVSDKPDVRMEDFLIQMSGQYRKIQSLNTVDVYEHIAR